LHVGLGLDFVFVCLFRFRPTLILCVSNVSLDHFVSLLLVFVVLGLVSLAPRAKDWLERMSPK